MNWTPLQHGRRHVSIYPLKSITKSNCSQLEIPMRETSIQMSFPETVSNSLCRFFGYANRLLQQLSGWLVSDDLGGEHAGCGGPESETPLETAYGICKHYLREVVLLCLDNVLDLWVQRTKNGNKNKSVVFIILFSVCTYVCVCAASDLSSPAFLCSIWLWASVLSSCSFRRSFSVWTACFSTSWAFRVATSCSTSRHLDA